MSTILKNIHILNANMSADSLSQVKMPLIHVASLSLDKTVGIYRFDISVTSHRHDINVADPL